MTTFQFDDDGAETKEIKGSDGLGVKRIVNTKVRSDGLTALVTDATVVVESTFGFDQQPDSFFRIIQTGNTGDTWTLFIAGTNIDPTTPDRDIPSFTKVFTVQAVEEGDELALRDRIVQELNADSTFRQVCFLKAQNATDRGVVHIYSEKFSASGEDYERPNAGDFSVTVTGTAQVVVGFDNLISRSKPVTITRDIDSPHRLGLFGITGSVNVTAKELSDIFFAEALNNGSPNMAVNGSLVSPIEFRIDAVPEKEIFVSTLIFSAQGNGIQFGNFLSRNQPLDNGIEVEIKSDNIITTFPLLKATEDFKNRWSALSGRADNFSLDIQSGADEMVAILNFENPFIIRAQGTFTTDDYITVKIRDNINNNPTRLDFAARGFEKAP